MQDQDKAQNTIGKELTDISQTELLWEQSTARRSKPEVPDSLLSQWQSMMNLIATLCTVPAALIMKVHSSDIEVFVSAEVNGNPYHAGEKASLNTGLYCEHVMSKREALLVPNALEDPKWDHNPDIALGMISYLGYPLQWPDGDIFGTICILDNVGNAYSLEVQKQLQLFKNIIESHLALLFEVEHRRQAEESLRISEERYRNFFETSRDCVFITDLNGKLIDVNDSGLELFGYQPRDKSNALERDVASFYSNPDEREVHAKWVIEKGYSKDYPIDVRKKDGSIINTLITTACRTDQQGAVIGFQGTIKDITARKHWEQGLHNTLKRFYTILSDSFAGLLLVTNEGVVEFVNQAMCDLFDIDVPPESLKGGAAPEMIGKLLGSYENPEETLARIKDVVAKNKPIRGEEVAVRGGRTYLVDYIPIVIDGKPYGRLWHHTDITNRKQTEAELRTKTHQLNERVKELHCLLAISKLVEKHDISLDQILRGVVDIIPQSWQYPEITCARVILQDKEFKTENHKVPISKQSAEIIAYGERIGELEVGYLEEASESDEGPFSREERNLINIIAERLGEIVQSKRAEAVQKSEMFLQEIVENIPDMVFVKDAKNLSFVRCNRAGEELLGYSREDLLGKNDYDFFPQNQADLFTAKDREVMATGKLAEILDEEIDTKFKGKRILHTKKIPILGPDGTPKFMLGISRDITERKRREVRLQESYARYRTILKTAMDGFCLVNEWGRILDVNDAYCEVMGYSCDELIGMNLTELEVIATQEQVWAHLRKILAQGSDRFETVQRRKDGSTVQMEVSAQFLSGEEGKLFLFLRDITDRRRSEKELCEREQMLKTILSASPVGIVHTQNSRIIWANRTWEAMFGFSDEREYLHQPTEIMHCSEVEYEHLRKMLYDNISSGGVSEADSKLRRKDGSVFDAHIRISLLDPEDSATGAISAITDVTERKLADEAVRSSEERFRILFQTSNEAIFLSDGLELIECNPKALQTFGCKDETDMVGYTPMEFSPERQPDGLDSKKEIPKYVQAALDSGPQTFYWMHCRKDGTPFDAEVTINGLILKGKPYLQGSVRDITESKLASEQLRQSEERYRTILTTAMDGFWLVDRTGKILEVNDAYCEMVGYGFEELIGKSIMDVDVTETESQVSGHLTKILEQGADRFETVHRRKDGSTVQVEVSVRLLPTEEGKMFAFFREISYRRKA